MACIKEEIHYRKSLQRCKVLLQERLTVNRRSFLHYAATMGSNPMASIRLKNITSQISRNTDSRNILSALFSGDSITVMHWEPARKTVTNQRREFESSSPDYPVLRGV